MKFNATARHSTTVRNHEGEKAWAMGSELELYTAVVTTTLGNKFYESAGDRVARIRDLISKSDPEFVAKLAVYAREKMFLRSIPLVLAVELAKTHQGDNLVSRMVNRIVLRADEITELLAYYQMSNQRAGTKKLGKLSKQVQKGLALAFNKFDEYQFAKYNRPAEVKLRDALFLVHPSPKDKEQQALFDKIAADTLATPETWEVKMSAMGQKAFTDESDKETARKETWESMIDSGKMGYMAMLRNLRNLLQARISDAHMERVCSRLADPAQVRKSKQFPFRFLSAYRELKGVSSVHTSMVLDALESAIQASVENMAGFGTETRVLVAGDVSGSMNVPISPRSKVQYYDIGLVLAMLLQHKCARVISGIFGTDFKVANLPKSNILQNTDTLRRLSSQVGWSTNGYKVIDHLVKNSIELDKVMIFTDLQLWNSNGDGGHLAKSWSKYKKIAPKAKLYLFDLAGYGQAPIDIRQPDVFAIAGWSDKVFEILDAIENGSDALAEIRKIVV